MQPFLSFLTIVGNFSSQISHLWLYVTIMIVICYIIIIPHNMYNMYNKIYIKHGDVKDTFSQKL